MLRRSRSTRRKLMAKTFVMSTALAGVIYLVVGDSLAGAAAFVISMTAGALMSRGVIPL